MKTETYNFAEVLENNPTRENKLSTTGKILIGVTGGIAVAISLVCSSFVSPAFRKICLPYVPATETQITNVMQALRGSTGRLIDLGSGDGRIVLEAAKHNFQADGIELNFWLFLYSKISTLFHNVHPKPKFHCGDLWKFDISPYNNVVIFGVEQMMEDLEKKVEKEVKEKSKVIACRFPLPNWIPDTIIGSGVDTVWVYKIK